MALILQVCKYDKIRESSRDTNAPVVAGDGTSTGSPGRAVCPLSVS